RFRPKILITGYSAYPRFPDFERFREIADKSGSILMCDMAHISGLVAAGVHPSPFEDCDVVTTTTHKTLRGPRGAMIFYRIGQKGVDKKGNAIAYDYAEKINSTVFPGMQGGPHNHIIAGLSVALKQAASVEFREYQEQVVANAAALATEMQKLGFNLVSGGTENHLMLVDLKNKGINGSKVEKVCELASITLNKNTVPGDRSAMNPSGLRIGSPAMTSRGCTEEDFRRVARFLNRAVDIALEV
ncbi:Serine hydroxymethyltransferase, cytosolic, partial [Perkinsus olseni]